MPARREAKDAYDDIEQARVEVVGAKFMSGVANNLRARLQEECEAEGYDRMTRKDQLPIHQALALLARERLSGEPSPPAAQKVLDLWRGTLGEGAEAALEEMARTTRSFDVTSKEATQFLQRAQVLVAELKRSVGKADPILANLNVATAEAAAASRHVRNVTAALDNPKTLAQLKTTVGNAERLTARIDAVGGDVNKLTSDAVFMDGVRSVAIGLGQLFDELYPAQTGLAKDKADAEAKKTAAPKPR
jgi:hypothetical protein